MGTSPDGGGPFTFPAHWPTAARAIAPHEAGRHAGAGVPASSAPPASRCGRSARRHGRRTRTARRSPAEGKPPARSTSRCSSRPGTPAWPPEVRHSSHGIPAASVDARIARRCIGSSRGASVSLYGTPLAARNVLMASAGAAIAKRAASPTRAHRMLTARAPAYPTQRPAHRDSARHANARAAAGACRAAAAPPAGRPSTAAAARHPRPHRRAGRIRRA